ncbi:MAG TPA: glycoside hydrolase family 65 protein [Anaerolineales bacterium]|jgi:kojibiose phosphorylase|nr:glycoside hydrolase family 65 protein [Anaerolineales bacterium]
MWNVVEESFEPDKQHHKETIFTIGNGYLSTRGAFEEGYSGDRRATFIHGVFDDVPLVFTELANAPDWLPIQIYLNGERFSLASGSVEHFSRQLNLRTGELTRTVRWCSSAGDRATLRFERFTSLHDEHLVCIRCHVEPEFDGELEIRASLNGTMDNEGFNHWNWVGQGSREDAYYLHTRTRATGIDVALAMRLIATPGAASVDYWDAQSIPTLRMVYPVKQGESITVDKFVGIATSRDTQDVVGMAVEHVLAAQNWDTALAENQQVWDREWERCDVEIDGDDEAQLAIRFNLFQLLIAAPRNDNRVNIGAKTLSGFGYRGHSFWDTEIFMLPLFIYTAPEIARNLLEYRHQRLPGARQKAQTNGFEGAQFPWESADTGEEVTPTWLPHFADRTKLIRIWTGDIEIHISADVAYATYLYWKVTGDQDWFIEKGAELILDTATFWASRAEWDEELQRYEYNDVIGPDEYHDHVDNNFYTNRMAKWNLETALEVLEWLKEHAPENAQELTERLELLPERLEKWQDVLSRIYLPVYSDGLIEQFEGYFQRRDVDLAALEPRNISVQALLGIEGCNETQVLKQPDVLMLQYLLRDTFSDEQIRVNYDYYTPRTDHTHGSSLGPSIQAIMACEVGKPDDAYEHFIRAVRADLRDVRHNAGDGIHGASAGGTWQAVVFGFGGLRVTPEGWSTHPRLPKHWKRLSFRFTHRNQLEVVEITNPVKAIQGEKPAS